MVNIVYAFVICNILFFLSACKREMYPVDPTGLTYKLNDFPTNSLNINGFYYKNINEGDSNSTIGVMYFFKNGSFCNFSSQEYRTKVNDKFGVALCEISESIRLIPYYWGRYKIENDTLKIQLVGSHREPFEKFEIEKEWGVITNDSTIVMFRKTIKNGIRELNEVYHFKRCGSMPEPSSILDKY